ncbi:MAG: hypothetical protein AVDCRST_MAG73-2838 [uncultured Thermomicrobiales bacterium]|uniref:Acetylglutamate kinase n=1 Tax=uncultured Thermomicrobiales bacterium TaxID=1645740 RepID=A0A6J4UKD6_9BACT|nr:MAG: hypothetical protein AVDCRST_MAG73-2838 [uncultured Thermomicrobiales bacterium]
MLYWGMRETAANRAKLLRRRLFERLVVRALDGLPPELRAMMDNVEVLIEDEPTAAHLAESDGPNDGDDELFGLYQGTPLIERSSSYGMALPDTITLFRGPLERACPNQAELAYQVRVTVVHELSHHVGLDEDRVAALGWA